MADHILPHEVGVRHWLRGSGVSHSDVDDVIQEAYCRLAAIAHFNEIDSSRAYLFVTIRNILGERARRARTLRIESLPEMGSLLVLDMAPSSERQVGDNQLLLLVSRLIEALPERCRNILILRKIEGLSQLQTARRLNLTKNIVSKELAYGLKTLTAQLSGEELGAQRRRAAFSRSQRGGALRTKPT